jgi:hypothetical protein
MGSEFTRLDTHVQERLRQFLDKMDTSLPEENFAKSATNAVS